MQIKTPRAALISRNQPFSQTLVHNNGLSRHLRIWHYCYRLASGLRHAERAPWPQTGALPTDAALFNLVLRASFARLPSQAAKHLGRYIAFCCQIRSSHSANSRHPFTRNAATLRMWMLYERLRLGKQKLDETLQRTMPIA